MSSKSNITKSQTEEYIKQVSLASNLNLSPERQQAQIEGFQRLLNEANDLNNLVSKVQFIDVTPVTVFRW